MRVVLYMAQTLNGFIARKNDEAPWSDTVFDAYFDFVQEYKNMIIGHRTFQIIDEAGELEALGHPEVIVLSHSLHALKHATVVSSPQAALEHLAAKGFKTAVVAGGAQCNASFWQEGLIDEVIIDVEPQIFGRGIAFFPPYDGEAKLKLLKSEELGEGVVRLHYTVR